MLLPVLALAILAATDELNTQALRAFRATPNLAAGIECPLRDRPDGTDFVMVNGTEFSNRPLDGAGSSDRLALENSVTCWPIEQDYCTDDLTFHSQRAMPLQAESKNGNVYLPSSTGWKTAGGAATALGLEWDASK